MPLAPEFILWSKATSKAITDTAVHLSDSFPAALLNRLTLQFINTLNQACTCTLQGSMDGTNWKDLPNPLAVSASSNDAGTLSDPWNYVRVKAQCSVAPGSGTLVVHTARRKVEA